MIHSARSIRHDVLEIVIGFVRKLPPQRRVMVALRTGDYTLSELAAIVRMREHALCELLAVMIDFGMVARRERNGGAEPRYTALPLLAAGAERRAA